MKILLPLLVIALIWSAAPSVHADRQFTELSDGWKFLKQDAAVTDSTDTWEKVSVPHCWNNFDGQDGKKAEPQYKDGYYRGPGWYERTIDAPTAWKDKRVFLRFEAAATVAQVYLNGKLLGEHRGNFTAFCFELTKDLKIGAANELRVRVDNSKVDDVAPLSGDFDIEGGIYRPVHLIVTDQVCISPLDYASSGVYLTPKDIVEVPENAKLNFGAAVDVKVVFSNASMSAVRGHALVTVFDATGNFVSKSDYPDMVELQPGETKTLTFLERIGHNIHRWNGRKDPYLYTATVRVFGPGYDDEVTQPLGFRTVALTNEQGFLLNGKPYPIYGVNRHQEKRDEGWALSEADHEEDLKLMLDMGVTAIRFAHYPQSEYVHDQCDRNGILLWNELSLVNVVNDKPEFAANAKQQLRELILQRYNHPSAVFWGMFNELDTKMDPVATPLLETLKAEQKELDPARLNVSATCHLKMKFNAVPDWICYNPYPGWYYKTADQLGKMIDEDFQDAGGKRIALSEYGGGSNPLQHTEEVPPPKTDQKGQFHPEEYQAWLHEQDWAQIRGNPKLWGSFLWCMFDFASDHRDEGGNPGVNDKGMVSEDRKIKKDVYYFYQANWSDVPMVHITGSRLTERHVPAMEVKVYSNGAKVELKLNGKPLGVLTPDDNHICRWEAVHLQPGANEVEAAITGSTVTDKVAWNYRVANP